MSKIFFNFLFVSYSVLVHYNVYMMRENITCFSVVNSASLYLVVILVIIVILEPSVRTIFKIMFVCLESVKFSFDILLLLRCYYG
jgi:high-affinity K+ transport system ATPase subunit B